MRHALVPTLGLLVLLATQGGCAVIGLSSVMAESFESQKLIEVPAKYPGLENHSVAVVVDTDLALMYEHPGLAETVTIQVSGQIQGKVPGAKVVSPQAVLAWQFSTPYWNTLPYGELTELLGTERVVYIDIHEYRLNPVGNSWLWDGVCIADVGIIERESIDSDSFAEVHPVRASFPDMPGVGRESATAQQIETGVLTRFIRQTAWLFYLHTEPKYPDKYQPRSDDSEYFREVGSR